MGQHGWEPVDFNVTHLPLVRSWERLVEVATPLTDRSKQLLIRHHFRSLNSVESSMDEIVSQT